jgi:hypothetical protein
MMKMMQQGQAGGNSRPGSARPGSTQPNAFGGMMQQQNGQQFNNMMMMKMQQQQGQQGGGGGGNNASQNPKVAMQLAQLQQRRWRRPSSLATRLARIRLSSCSG